MSKHGIMVMPFGDIPRNAFVKVNGKTITHRDYKVKVEDPSIYVMLLPKVDLILLMLNQISASWAVLFNPHIDRYTVVGFEYGLMDVDTAPVFEEGKVVGYREIQVKTHLSIRSAKFDDCVRRLFRAAISGKLYQPTIQKENGKQLYKRLYWDKTDSSFNTELVPESAVKRIRRKA